MSQAQAATTTAGKMLLRPREAAAACGVSERTVWTWTNIPNGLKCVRIGGAVRYDPADLKDFIDRNKSTPPAAASA